MDQIVRKPGSDADDLEPNYRWDRHLPAWGTMGVDFESRVEFDRMRRYRIARARQALERSDLGALLLFDVNNIRYVTATKIGEWERDKLGRFALLAKGQEPILWDFGSAAVHHRLYSTGWCRTMQGRHRRHARHRAAQLRPDEVPRRGDRRAAARGRRRQHADRRRPHRTAMLFELEKAGLKVDGQQVMLDAREIKNIDEIALLKQAAAMVDGVYHLIYEELKPGVRENNIVANANSCSTSSAPTTSRRSTPFPASAATRTRTISPTA